MYWYKVRSMLCVLTIISIPFCTQTAPQTTNVYSPVYLSYAELRNSYSFDAPQDVKKAGKIYLYGNYLFVNEVQKGVHVVDVSTPSNPQNIGFINIPGNVDIAIKNNVLYADSFVDLVVIDITVPTAPTQITRVNDLFPYPYYYADNMAYLDVGYSYYDPTVIFDGIDTTLGIVVGWVFSRQEEIQAVASSACNLFTRPPMEYISGGETTATSGTGGSLARFIVLLGGTHDYLYTLNHTDLNILDITTETNPILYSTYPVGWEIKSLFVDGNNLFISSSYSISIYSIGGSPGGTITNPQLTSNYARNSGCSAVIASGNYMYATVNSTATNCYNSDNHLDVIDISNIYNPQIVSSFYTVVNPFGLAIDSTHNVILVADGYAGLKLYNAATPVNLQLFSPVISAPINYVTTGDALHDLILTSTQAFVVGDSGIYIYDTTNIATGGLSLVGSLQIVP